MTGIAMTSHQPDTPPNQVVTVSRKRISHKIPVAPFKRA